MKKTVLKLKFSKPWLAIVLSLATHGQSARLLDTSYLDALRAEVRTNHPTASAAHARVRAAQAGMSAVRLWEDPVAGVGVMAAEREMRADEGDIMILADQVLPRRKLYEARKTRAAAERSMFEAEARAAILGLETLVAQTAIELAFADEMLVVQTNQLGWLERIAANAREQLKDPRGNASEPLRIESEMAQERQKLDSTERTRARLIRQLDILLGRTEGEAWAGLRLPDSANAAPALSGELQRLFQANPMLHALLNSANAARAEIEVTQRERSPIFSVGVESSVYSGGDFRQTKVIGKMTLPLFNKSIYRANVQRAEHQKAAAEKELEALQRKLQGEAVAAHSAAETAAHQAEVFTKEVIPRAVKAAESTESAWITTQANVLEVLESRRAVLNARIEERRSVAAYLAALETLRSIVPPQTNP